MKGTAHTFIGAATGFVVANNFQADPKETIILIGIGGLAGLVPDLDIGGKLRHKLTIPHTYIQHIAQFIGLLLLLYSFIKSTDGFSAISGGLGAAIFLLATLFKQKHMLMITGIGVCIGGYALEEWWVFLFGGYIFIASICAHRTYTHSLLGLCFFGLIGYLIEQSTGLEGIYYACIFGYVSHLAADSKLLPFNKSGIPLFLPIWRKEF